MRAAARPLDLGDFLLIMLTTTMAGMRDRLALDGFLPAAELVADLVDIADDYLARAAEQQEEVEG